jgi:DNA polymerase-1
VDGEGRPVNALLGTVNAILSVLEARPSGQGVRAVVACTGAEQAAYRVRLYPPYHAHRPPMPSDLAEQWVKAPALLASLAWTVADGGDLEADDVMFSYARTEEEHGGIALLLTGDRDLYGATSERVAVLELRKGGEQGEIGPKEVRQRYGVEPEQVADFIALRGDPSDGLPGAPGIGAKTAAELLREHGSLEGLLDAARHPGGAGRSLRPRVVSALLDNAELLSAFREVATLARIDVERPADTPTDFAAGASAAQELGMRRLAARLGALAPA